MKYRLAALLCCPSCKGDLTLIVFDDTENNSNANVNSFDSSICKNYCFYKNKNLHEIDKHICLSCNTKEIKEGLLFCKCGLCFPIIDNIPRFLNDSLSLFPEFYNKHRNQIECLSDNLKNKLNNFSLDQNFSKIHQSFTKEWNFYDYEKDKTWGWDLEQRKNIFLDDVGFEKKTISNKLILDAGCGNGKLTASIADFNCEIVGLDISDSIIRAEFNKKKFANCKEHNVHFVQGSLYDPPLKEKSFDLIYCSGVLHHTPNTKATFERITPLIKQNGRIYIWVYGERGLLISGFMAHGRFLKNIISLETLFVYCRMLSPVYRIVTDLLNNLKIYEFRKRTTREIALDLFDCFSPEYNHPHTREEVCKWFQEQGFTAIMVCGLQKHGFGVRADKTQHSKILQL